MSTQNATTAATVLGAVGVILLMAGAFGVMPMSYAIFLGVASFISAGTVKKIAGVEK